VPGRKRSKRDRPDVQKWKELRDTFLPKDTGRREFLVRTVSRICWLIVVLIVVGLTVDYCRVQAKEHRVFRTISQFGGRSVSIPAWPIGAENRNTFTRALTSQELAELHELNTLRGWVGVAFEDCELSDDQIREAVGNLPRCKLFRVVDGDMSPLASDH
jgi:hypothetical protein